MTIRPCLPTRFLKYLRGVSTSHIKEGASVGVQVSRVKPRMQKAVLVGVGLGVLAADILNREVRRLAKETRLSKPAARRAASQALKAARKEAAQLERRLLAVHKKYRSRALALAENYTEEALARLRAAAAPPPRKKRR